MPGIPEPTVDFVTSYPASVGVPAGFPTPTGSGDPIYIDYPGDGIFGISATNVVVDIAGVAHVHGSLDFEMGGSAEVAVNTGIPANVAALLPDNVNPFTKFSIAG